jgi:hypothetical protein
MLRSDFDNLLAQQ